MTDHDDALTSGQVRSRATAGVGMVAIRGLLIRLLALGGNIVLARMLLPEDFGAVAVGTTLVFLFSLIADGGIGAGLIRRAGRPTHEELRSLLFLQLVITASIAGTTALVTVPFGLVGRVTAVIVASLPIMAFRAPGFISLERQLRYRPLVIVELAEALGYYVWAIVTVHLGWGVWGLATGAIVRAIAGSVMMIAVAPERVLLPRLALGELRSLLRFGAQYSAAGVVSALRDGGVNIGVLAVSGTATLGLWNLANRVLQIPFLMFESLWRISFPAMARLATLEDDPRPVLGNTVSSAGIATGVMFAAIVGAGPALIPSVFGDQWADAAPVVPWALLGLLVSGPVSVAAVGFLYAEGKAGTVLSGVIADALLWTAVGLPLLPVIGVAAVGIGSAVGSLGEAVLYNRGVRRHLGMSLFPPLATPAVAAGIAGGLGWLVGTALPSTLLSAVATSVAATALYLVAVGVTVRERLLATWRISRRAVVAALTVGDEPETGAPLGLA